MKIKGVMFLLLLAGAGTVLHAEADPRPGRLLEALAESYEIDDDEDYAVEWQFENSERSQRAIVTSEAYWKQTQEGRKLTEMRDLWATVCRREILSPEDMNMLFEENYNSVLGFYAIRGSHLIYCARIPADCDTATLAAALLDVMVSADDMEELLTGKDEF